MASNTRWTVLKRIIQDYPALGWACVNDANQSDVTTLSDDSVLGGRSRNMPAVGADVRTRQNSVSGDTGTNTYGEARVSKAATFAAGTITMDPDPGSTALPETPNTSNNYTEFLILKDPDMRFEDGCNLMNKARLGYGWEKLIIPLTSVLDGDMLKSSVDTSTDWVNGGTSTLAKNAASSVQPRYMSLTGSGSSQYVETTSIAVEQGEQYYYEVCAAKASSSDGTVSLQDITGSTTITLTNTSIDERVPIILANSVTMNSTTEQVRCRVAKADGGGTQTIAIFYIILRKQNALRFTVQDRPAKVLWLGEMRITNRTKFEERSFEDMTAIPARPRQVGAGVWEYQIDRSIAGYAAFYEEFIQPAQFTADSDTTTIEVEDLAAVTAELWLRPKQRDPKWADTYQSALFAAVEARQRRQAQLQSMRQEAQLVLSPQRI